MIKSFNRRRGGRDAVNGRREIAPIPPEEGEKFALHRRTSPDKLSRANSSSHRLFK